MKGFLTTLIVLVVLGLVFSAALYYLSKNRRSIPSLSSSGSPAASVPASLANASPTASIQVFTGTVVCLNVKPGVGYEEDGCTLGLKTDSNVYYYIGGNKDPKTLIEGRRIQVSGVIDPTATVSYYDVAGYINSIQIQPL